MQGARQGRVDAIADLTRWWEPSWPGAIATLALAGLGAWGLVLLYRRIGSEWPDIYQSVDTVADEQVRRGFMRHYLGFRAGPVFLLTLFVGVTVERLNGLVWVAGLSMVAVHLGVTNFRALRRALRFYSRPRKVTVVFHHIGVIVITVTAAVAAISLRDVLQALVPRPRDVLLAVWAGFFAALFATAARLFMKRPSHGSGYDLDDLISDVGGDNWRYIGQVAERMACDEILLKAIILAEVEQRPRWLRRAERLKGFFVRRGTYGVAQVLADRPISDRESIEELGRRFSGVNIREMDSQDRRLVLEGHSLDHQHLSRIIYYYDRGPR